MIICWWSGGVTSAVACKKAIEIYGKEKCRVIFMDTHNEHEDTYRFKKDCEKWYEVEIEVISEIGKDYDSIQDVWMHHKQLNTANGAICSSRLKATLRTRWQKQNVFSHQVFGFEFEKKEFNRAMAMKLDHPETNALFPLLHFGLDKESCFKILNDEKIEIPTMYKLGFKNNNCFKTGCIQGGIGYWQKIKREFPDKFEAMAKLEHELTEIRGYQITMLKDQSKEAQKKPFKEQLVFLKKHPIYPNKCIDEMTARELEPIVDCNGFCGTNDINPKSKTYEEINLEKEATNEQR